MNKIIKLMHSCNAGDVLIGITLATKKFTETEFRKCLKIQEYQGERLYCFWAYDILWKCVLTYKGAYIFESSQDLKTCISVGYKYIEL